VGRRRVAVVLALTVLVAALGTRPARASTSDLVVGLDAMVRSFEGGAGLWVADPAATQPLYSAGADERVVTASLYKLGILLHVESLVEQGRLSYTDSLTIEDEDITDDGSFESAGTVLTIDQALEEMVTYSDNGTALAFWHTLGPEGINATIQAQRIGDFHIALSADEDNVATPRAVGTYFTLLAKRQLVSPAASDRMLARLERQHINDRLPSQLPEGVTVAHKTGNLAGLTHDAGIIFTPQGPRVVVAMTWDAPEDVAAGFIAGVGSLVYSALLEPPTNARYIVPRQVAADTGGTADVPVKVTNAGPQPWPSTGAGSVGLVYDVIDARGGTAGRSAWSVPVGPARVGQTVAISLLVTVPDAVGDYTVRVGIADASGRALAALGAATARLTLHAHPPFVAGTIVRVPTTLHQGEASLVVVQYAPLPAAGVRTHPLTLAARFVDRATGRVVAQLQVPLGTLDPAASGTFFVPLVAPRLAGLFRLDTEIREQNVVAGATASTVVTIQDPRTYPGDESRVAPRISTRPATPRPSSRP
jgi:beta-lactamase class A